MNELANNKADAKISALKILVRDWEKIYEEKSFGGLTDEQVKLLVDGYKKELKIWEYIKTKLI